jgi:hypothetical protein
VLVPSAAARTRPSVCRIPSTKSDWRSVTPISFNTIQFTTAGDGVSDSKDSQTRHPVPSGSNR